MTADSAMLVLELRSFWLHANGEGGGADFDLVMERDRDGLPLLRGRHVAGLLRLALTRADCWGWFSDPPLGVEVASLLMGDIGDGAPGCLDVRSAQVVGATRAALVANPALREACFQRLPTTAIDERLGVAREGQLRAVEAALPLPLVARLGFDSADRMAWARAEAVEAANIALAKVHWRGWLRTALPALDEAGAKRTRGFGRLGPCQLINAAGDLS